MEKIISKRNVHDPKSKITDQGDIFKLTEKANPRTKIKDGLIQADRGDSKKFVLKSSVQVADIKNDKGDNKPSKYAKLDSVKDEVFDPKPINVTPDTLLKDGDTYLEVDSTIESQMRQVLKAKENENDKKYVKSNEYQNKKKNVKILDANERKKIRDKYTIRPKITSDGNRVSNPAQNDCSQKICLDQCLNKDKLDCKSVSTNTKDSNSYRKSEKSNRKPVITTIRSKNDTKVYKTVTFTEHNQRQATPIEIKIPIDVKRKEKEKQYDKNIEISNSSKEKSNQKSSRKKQRHFPSPERGLFRKGDSPPTEVAKWAPSCVNRHTIPYYEAWVDTTLAAISKCSKNDKKQNLLTSFRRFLERPGTPELVYNQMDERYTGKIKVRQRKL